MEYITSRDFALPSDPGEFSRGTWFNRWSKKLWPYHEVVEGDVVYWYESRTKTIVWKSRVVATMRCSYADPGELRRSLISFYTDVELETPYVHNAPPAGYVFALKVKAIARTNLVRPAGFRFPQQGWLRIGDEIARSWLGQEQAADEVTLNDLTRPPVETAPVAEDDQPESRLSIRGQGHEPDPLVKKAIEDYAMSLAEAHYRREGYDVEVTAQTEPFDLRCRKGGSEVRVEVKGTRSEGATVEVTIGEVKNARGSGWRTDLYVVRSINVVRGDPPIASGGNVHLVRGWKPTETDLSPIRFRCNVPATGDGLSVTT